MSRSAELKKIILQSGTGIVSVFIGTLANGEAFQPMYKLDAKLSDGSTIIIGTLLAGG